MNLTSLILYLLLGLMALIAGVSLVTIILRSQNVTWNHLRTFLLHKRPAALMLVLVLIFGCTFGYLKHMDAKHSATVTVTLNYAEASNGLNTNGTRYSIAELTSPEVLELAIAEGALENVTPEQLAQCLRVEPAVQGSANSEDEYHIATEYLIHYTATPETSHLDPENLVSLIANAYKTCYIARHGRNYQMLELAETLDISGLDYLDAVELLKKELQKVRNYMYGMSDLSSSFTDSNGSTFYAIAAKLSQLEDVQIEANLVSYILHNGISKDADGYISRLNYDNQQLEFDRQRAAAAYQVHNDAVKLYAEEMTRVVLVPTWDENGEYYMGRTKVGIDELSVDAEEHSQDAAKYLEKISENRQTITAMDAATSGTDAHADEMIAQIYATIRKYAAEAKQAAQEYTDTQMNQCIRATVEGASLMMTLFWTIAASLLFYVTLRLVQIARALPRREKLASQKTKTKSPASRV